MTQFEQSIISLKLRNLYHIIFINTTKQTKINTKYFDNETKSGLKLTIIIVTRRILYYALCEM